MKCGSRRRRPLVFPQITACALQPVPLDCTCGSKQEAEQREENCGAIGGTLARTFGLGTGFVSGTHGRYEELLDLLHRSPHLDLRPGLRVLHRDQDVEVFV